MDEDLMQLMWAAMACVGIVVYGFLIR